MSDPDKKEIANLLSKLTKTNMDTPGIETAGKVFLELSLRESLILQTCVFMALSEFIKAD